MSTCGHEDDDTMIDIVGDQAGPMVATHSALADQPSSASTSSGKLCLLLPEDNAAGLRFVREAAADVGVKLRPHQVDEECVYPAVEKIIYKVRGFSLVPSHITSG